MHRQLGLQVRKREIDPSVAAILGAKQREQGLVLVDRQELAVTKRPAFWREVEAHHGDLAEKWSTHRSSSLDPRALPASLSCAPGICPAGRCKNSLLRR